MTAEPTWEPTPARQGGNVPILYRNIIHGLDCEDAANFFLKQVDAIGVLRAEVAAYRWRDVRSAVKPMLDAAQALHPGKADVRASVLSFIRTRAFHHERAAHRAEAPQ